MTNEYIHALMQDLINREIIIEYDLNIKEIEENVFNYDTTVTFKKGGPPVVITTVVTKN